MKIAFALLAFAACGYSPDLGDAPFVCGTSDPKCPDGYDCVPSGTTNVCLKAGGEVPDAGTGQCANDSPLEPNNTYMAAYTINSPFPVVNGAKTITFAGLAICPAGDIDTYKVTTEQNNQTLTATITYVTEETPLTVNLLTTNGTVSKMGSSTTAGMASVAENVATVGVVYVQVQPTTNGTNGNYKLALTLTP
ncbi:MAG: hypothetical protein QM831_07375 [Kofleriaceae bacterium]